MVDSVKIRPERKVKSSIVIMLMVMFLVITSATAIYVYPKSDDFTPRGIRIIPNIDSENSIKIIWYTKEQAFNPKVELWDADYVDQPDSIIPSVEKVKGYFIYTAKLQNLENGHKYEYQVSSDILNRREMMIFKYQLSNSHNLKFLIWGDTRTGRGIRQQLAEKIVEEFDIEFAIHVGDIVEDGGDQENWNGYFTDTEILNSYVPTFYVQGNHETGSSSLMYENIPILNEGDLLGYFYFNLGPLELIVLNSNLDNEKQTEFIERYEDSMRGESENDWRFTIFHHPFFLKDEGNFINKWSPIFGERVNDLILTGHMHNYARSFPFNISKQIKDSQKYDYTNPHYPISIISGGGGAPLKTDEILNATFSPLNYISIYKNVHHVIIGEINHNILKLEAWGLPYLSGTENYGDSYLMDNITITKF